MKRIYLDNAATTPVEEGVLKEMLKAFRYDFGNPSALYYEGREACKWVEQSRKKISDAIGADYKEIFFTSGGSESDNWAIRGIAEAKKEQGRHIITTQIEHPAVLQTCKHLESHGYEVTYLPVDEQGIIRLEDFQKALRADTILVSMMFANNEVGSIQPIHEVGILLRDHPAVFHTDAIQAFGSVNIDVNLLNIDMLSISGHKIYGPKGIGALYVRKGIALTPLIFGGDQERGYRAGTENVPSILGIGKAAEEANQTLLKNNNKIELMRHQLIAGVLKECPSARLTGPEDNRLPGNASFVFEGMLSQTLVTQLDLAGIAASGGSACQAGSLEPSHVLKAMGYSEALSKGALRLSIGKHNTSEEIAKVIYTLGKIYQKHKLNEN